MAFSQKEWKANCKGPFSWMGIVRSTIVGLVGIPKCFSEKRVVVSPFFPLL